MTLEVLFARAAQGQAFLLLLAGGVALGLLLQLAGFAHRWNRAAGMAADVLCAAALMALVLLTALATGTGLRLYGLLGLCIGLLLYAAGIGPVVEKMMGFLRKSFHRKAGMAGIHAESSVHR